MLIRFQQLSYNIMFFFKGWIGYLSKIFLSKFGRHFDVNPKGWRLFVEFMENTSFGMEILAPDFPHLFVQISAVAGAEQSCSCTYPVYGVFLFYMLQQGVVFMLVLPLKETLLR